MKNIEQYQTLEEQIEHFTKYCDSQPSCPCKYNNEHCQLKWLHEKIGKGNNNEK